MTLLLLLAVPVITGIAALIIGKGKITLKEFLIQEAAVIVVIGIAYAIALSRNTADTEIWNGVVARKWQDTEHCCHSYECNCHESCSGSGENRSCHTVCQTCYRHFQDITWEAISSNGENIFSDGCNPPGSGSPSRWDKIQIGEPTAVEHSFDNYIKANASSVLVRQSVPERLLKIVPPYPAVYDHYRADRFIPVRLRLPNLAYFNRELARINAREGAPRQVNITVLVAKVSDRDYLEAVRKSWVGGKKNDVIVVLGVPQFPRIAWAGVISWSRSEDMKVAIKNRVLDLPEYNGGEVLRVIEEEVRSKFVRRRWRDFEYLTATVEPSGGVTVFLFIFGCLLAVGIQIFFYRNDPFGDERYAVSRSALRAFRTRGF